MIVAMPPKPPPIASWLPKSQHGHVIRNIRFGERRFLLCSCGHLIKGEPDDDEQGLAFAAHRRASPPEKRLPKRTRVGIAPPIASAQFRNA